MMKSKPRQNRLTLYFPSPTCWTWYFWRHLHVDSCCWITSWIFTMSAGARTNCTIDPSTAGNTNTQQQLATGSGYADDKKRARARLSATELFRSRSPASEFNLERTTAPRHVCSFPASFLQSSQHVWHLETVTFAVTGPRAWNSLPPALRSTFKSFSSFKIELKSFIFGFSF